jgi:hypothetical protein
LKGKFHYGSKVVMAYGTFISSKRKWEIKSSKCYMTSCLVSYVMYVGLPVSISRPTRYI